MFDHIQKILNEVKNFFELADGIGMSLEIGKKVLGSFDNVPSWTAMINRPVHHRCRAYLHVND